MYSRVMETNADILLADYWVEYLDKSLYVKIPYDECRKSFLRNIVRGECNPLWIKLVRRSLYLMNNINWSEGMDMAEDYTITIPLCFSAKKLYIFHMLFITI